MEENQFLKVTPIPQMRITYSPGWNLWEGETLMLDCEVSSNITLDTFENTHWTEAKQVKSKTLMLNCEVSTTQSLSS